MAPTGNGRRTLKGERRGTPRPPRAEAPAPRARKPARRKASRPSALALPFVLLARLVRAVVRLIWAAVWRLGAVAALIFGGIVLYDYVRLPDAGELVDGRAGGSVTLLDAEGQVFAWRGEQFGGVLPVEHMSPHLVNAVIATEDRRFWQHWGISPRGIVGAIRINLAAGRRPFEGHGGSTITQQTAKLLCLGEPYDPSAGLTLAQFEAECRRSSVVRKLREVPFAMAMEARYSKDDILKIYMNRAYLGAGAQGFEAASQRYFGKSAAQVTPSEAAMLAGLLIAPSRFAPTTNLARAQARADTILRLMHEQGYLETAELAEARANPARLSQAAEARAGGHFADWVMEAGPSFLTRATTEDVIIRTTFDQRVQRAAEEALVHVFETRVREGSEAQAAILVMSADGAVRALVGGRDLRRAGQFNRATQALRQTGSAFKLFVYAAALDLGFRFDTPVYDEPITIDVPGSGPWSPRNYSNRFDGEMTLTQAFAQSSNTVAVKVSEAVGRESVREVTRGFGIRSPLVPGPALALGTSEATLLEMTAAYAGVLNGGRAVEPYGLVELSLRGTQGPLMGQEGGMGDRVISEDAARQLTYMMTQVIEA
ncbi:MAG: transglycosylase domain-containing protein, partial [Rhodobacteraceae bacterium]|nr:transglycosylase domain-containing protein [Paracoccaceae bacterium]